MCINLRGLSFRPWKVFAIITRADGKQIRGYYYCTKCRKILKSMCKSNGLNCHKCVLDIKQTDIVNYVQTKITSGVYKMKPYGEKSSNPVWERFSLISRPNDSLVVGMVCCQNCKMVMKYNELLGGDDRLLQHICMEGGEDTNTR